MVLPKAADAREDGEPGDKVRANKNDNKTSIGSFLRAPASTAVGIY